MTAIIAQEDFQWIWAVLAGFKKDISLDEVLKHSLPTVEHEGFWSSTPTMQHPLASVEIVPFDSSFTLFLTRDKQLIDGYVSAFPKSEDLASYNTRYTSPKEQSQMNTYTLPCLDSIDWSKCFIQPLNQCRWSPNAAPAASVQGLYLNNTALVFRIESSALPERAENTGVDSAVWEDSCLECFFSFDGVNYVNLEANANSALRASFGPDRHDRKFLRDMGVAMPKAEAKLLDCGWELIFTIPLGTVEDLWGRRPQPGDSFSANFYSCGDKTPAPHYASWNAVETEAPDFHRPEFFGKIIIG